MSQPLPPPDTFTFQEAVAALATAQTALAAQDAVAAAVLDMSSAVIAAREVAAAYAKGLISALWADVDPYDGNAVQDFTATAARHMATAQTATARTAASAQSVILRSMGIPVTGRPSNPLDVRSPGADVVDGRLVLQRPETVRVAYDTRAAASISAADMTTQEVFNRPARTVRAEVADGATIEQADARARERIEQIVDDNVMLAQRLAEAEVLQQAVELDEPAAPTIIGYRRVIHPELSRTGVCGLCIAAADQKYKVGDLLPLHARCKCTIAAITAEHDPADDVNAADLAALYDLAGSTSGRSLKRVRFQVDEHGELGPVLAPKRRSESAGQRPRRQRGPEKKSDVARRQLPIFEANLEKLLAQGMSEESPQVTYHRRQIKRWRTELANA